MNIKLLNNYSTEVRKEIIASGFKRDLADYIASLPSNEDNIVGLRKIAGDVENYLKSIYHSDIPRYLKALIPEELGTPFTETNYLDQFQSLISDPNITQENFYAILNNTITSLSEEVDSDIESINDLDKFIKPYVDHHQTKATGKGATVSLIFHDEPTVHSLSHLTKSLAAWNRLLPIYHQLLKEESPEDIRVEGVESGSIDLIVNLDVDVSLNLVEAFKVGLKAFAAYLSYKKLLEPYIATYVNKKLIKLEEEKDQLLLENIGEAVRQKIEEQHDIAFKSSDRVSGEAKFKKIEQVAKLFTSHIVKGNDIKLLALPEAANQADKSRAQSEGDELKKVSLETRLQLRDMGADARQELLEMYVAPAEEEIPRNQDTHSETITSRRKQPTKKSAAKHSENP